MTIYIFFLFLIQIISHSLYGALDNPTIKFNLKFPDGKIISQNWNQDNFQKIRTLNDTLQDIGSLTEFTYPVPEDQTYLNHNYFKKLITGDFNNQTDDHLINYINNYNYFIGSEVDIHLPHNDKYQLFPSSLKWKVFKNNEKFFRKNLNNDNQNDDQKVLQNTLRTFLCYGLRKNPLSLFEIKKMDLTLAKNAKKLSLNSPFIFDFQVFEEISKAEKNFITWLDFSNSILCNLNLHILLQYFPNLHKVTVNNTFIKKITEDDIAILKNMRDKAIISDSEPEYPEQFIDEDEMMNFYAANKERMHKGTDPDQVKKMLDYGNEINWYSFVLELNGCPVQNPEALLGLQNNEPNKRYHKSICIKGIAIDHAQQFQKILSQFFKLKKQFLLCLILITANILVTGFCLKNVFIKGPLPTELILKIALIIVNLSIFTYTLLNDLYKKACLINDVGIVFQ